MKKILMLLAFMLFVWSVQATYTDDCITFSSTASFTLKTKNTAKNWDGTLWTSTDKVNWAEWNGAEVMSAQTGGMGLYNLYVRGNTNNTGITGALNATWRLTGTVDIACSGNIETLRGAIGNSPSPTPMANYCYQEMFRGCALLSSAPTLPETVLKRACYAGMFADCSALAAPPVLPATALAESCYEGMFMRCTKIVAMPKLPAMTLANSCYRCMFDSCTSLVTISNLPATTLADHCYYGMFGNCTSLKCVPALPATTLVMSCYGEMFSGCTSLRVNTSAPGLEWKVPATVGATYWGVYMFADTSGNLKGQPALNTTYYIASAPKNDDCITFSSEGSFSLHTQNDAKNWNGTLMTSTDKVNWAEWSGGEVKSAQTDGTGTYNLYVRGDESNTKIAGDYACRWVLVGDSIACSGNIETLRGATGDAPSSTPMADFCYSAMFDSCTSLTSAPTLPAMKLAFQCYDNMFNGCTSLKAAPALPATTLSVACYSGMFANCTSLTNTPALQAIVLAKECYQYMFSNCPSLTTLPALPATTLVDFCYFQMFERCTSLEVNTVGPGPEWVIPATDTTAVSWGAWMFSGTKGKVQDQPELNTTYYVASARLPEGGPYKETVDGVEWTFMVIDSKASVGGGTYNSPAVSTSTTGLIEIPPVLGGCPVVSIGDYAFNGCSSLTGVMIPSDVTSIGLSAFYNCSGLTSITIPTGVSDIRYWTFAKCSALTSITIPAGVASIGESAFYCCSGLTNVTISAGVTSIGYMAFSACRGLTAVSIPSSVTSIFGQAFSGCNGLMEINVDPANPNYKSVCGLLLTKDEETLVQGVNGNVMIPPSVKTIGNDAFYGCSGLTNLTMAEGVANIGQWAFYRCKGMTNLTIPSSVTNIGNNAFFECASLNAIDFEGAPPAGLSKAKFNADAAIRYNVAYETQWLQAIQQCGWTNAQSYVPCPRVVGVTAQQRYPWNGKVDITYTVENAGTETREIRVCAVDQTTGFTNVAKTISGDTAYTSGGHHIVWDMSSEGHYFVSTNVVFTVAYIRSPSYIVIDLSGGASAESYPVIYLDEAPNGGWSEEYKTTKLVLRKISGGAFTMGSPTDELGRDNDETQHHVMLTKDCWMGIFEVTQRQWELVMGDKPSYFNNSTYYAARPVEQVSYDMIRGSLAGAGWPDSSSVDKMSFLGILLDKSRLQLDLPTEAQWEYACRAGTTTALNSGKNLTSQYQDSEMAKVGRYWYNSYQGLSQSCDLSAGTAEVGSYEPNALGLYDMHGNVCEWCLDWVGDYSGDATDPTGPSSGSGRVARGGGWGYNADYCRSASRFCNAPSDIRYYFGFRLVGTPTEGATAEHVTIGGSSHSIQIDLTPGTRIAANTETITYSTGWGEMPADAVAVVSVNGQVLSEASGSGVVVWTPAIGSANELTHVVMKDGVPIGETLTAYFNGTGPHTEVVDGVEWTYMVFGKKVMLGSGNPDGPTAVSKSVAGVLVIPEKLGGCVVTDIGAYAFKDCIGLTEVVMPTNIVTIGDNAFANDYYLDNVVIPNSVLEIGDGAFLNCTEMASLTLGSGIKTVGNSAFENCITLESVAFQEGLTNLGARAFAADIATRLRSMSLPMSLVDIGDDAFLNNGDVTGVSMPTHIMTMKELFPDSYQKIETVVVPDGEGVVIDSTFADCTGLKTIIIPPSVTNIGAAAFAHCEALEELGLPDEVSTLGDRAFYGCLFLKTVALPRHLTAIGDETFCLCPSLDSLVIPASVSRLGAEIYSGGRMWSLECKPGWTKSQSEYTTRNGIYGRWYYHDAQSLTGVYFLGNAPETQSNSYEGMPIALTSYVVKGSTGWYISGSPTLPPNGWPTTGNSRSITYWTPNEFEVTFDGNGGSPETYVSKQITDTTYSLPKSEPVRAGYLFRGWWTERKAGAQIYWNTRVTATKAHTLYAHWKSLAETVTVVFNPNGGTVEPSERTYPAGVTFGELPVPTRIGHNFVGWYTSQVGGDLVDESTPVTEENNELYAHWTPITYGILFDANGGSGNMDVQPHTYNVPLSLSPNAYHLVGFNFTGWSETRGGVVKYANKQVVENLAEIQDHIVTLYAVWDGAKYAVRFDANGGEGIMTNQTHQVGVRQALDKCAFTRKGYSFLGWATTPQGVVEYDDEEEVQNLTMQASSTVPLYAVWSPNPYTIEYDANGGTGEMAATACIYDKEVEIAECGFTNSGHSFSGWATSAEGEVVYTPGQMVLNLTDEAGDVVTLYAVWVEAGVEAPVFSPGDGTVFADTCTVTLTCPTSGADIYYRVGAKPKASSKYLYSSSFEITETSTVYAFAKVGDQESDCVTATFTKGKVITFEEAVDALGIISFTHGGDVVWGVEEESGAYLGKACARSGAIGDDQVSWFEAKVQGAGTLTFHWKASCEEDELQEWDHLAFNIDGADEDYARLDGITDWREVVVKLDAGAHTLRWSYVKDEDDSEGEGCGWVDCITWIEDAPPVEPGGKTDYTPEGWTRPIVVSNDWLIAKGLVKDGAPASKATEKLSETGKNGIPRFESYLLGMEPDSDVPANEQLKVTIEGFDDDGVPIIRYNPKPNDATRVKYSTIGKPDLNTDEWELVTDLNKHLMRFYRVRVEFVSNDL